jgi:hypothetical protein
VSTKHEVSTSKLHKDCVLEEDGRRGRRFIMNTQERGIRMGSTNHGDASHEHSDCMNNKKPLENSDSLSMKNQSHSSYTMRKMRIMLGMLVNGIAGRRSNRTSGRMVSCLG